MNYIAGSTDYYFSHARTALKFGLKSLNFRKNDIILLPEFICSVIIEPITSLGLIIKYYQVLQNLEPNWDQLDILAKIYSPKGLLMVHYFGKCQDINRFKNFCLDNKILLIEDNSHGFGNKINSQYLGSFGDIGITSPRKILNLKYGGILHINNSNFKITPSYYNLKTINTNSISDKIKRYLKNASPKLLNLFKSLFLNFPDYQDPYSFQEYKIPEYYLTQKSIKLINSLSTNSQKKISNYNSWKRILLNYNYLELVSNRDENITPYCFSFYAKDKDDAYKFYRWGWENGYYIYSWPSLPNEVINKNLSALTIWERLVCISLDSPAPNKFNNFINNLNE